LRLTKFLGELYEVARDLTGPADDVRVVLEVQDSEVDVLLQVVRKSAFP
jgi:hypothetical protein